MRRGILERNSGASALYLYVGDGRGQTDAPKEEMKVGTAAFEVKQPGVCCGVVVAKETETGGSLQNGQGDFWADS